MTTKLLIGLTALFLAIAGTGCGSKGPGEQSPQMTTSVEEAAQQKESPASQTAGDEPEAEDVVAEYHKIAPEEAREIMSESEQFILLDVRTDEEFRENHIDGAVLIPDYEVKERAETELPDREALILLYCRSGRRSAEAANVLVDMGYTNVYDFGGIIDWPYDTVSDE